MGVTYSQFFPPTPAFADADVPSQRGKVFIVTGGTSGIGFELCRILYRAGGKVYLAIRSSRDDANNVITKIKREFPDSLGHLRSLFIELDDLSTIKPAVQIFLTLESRLDVLFNNAGVSNPP